MVRDSLRILAVVVVVVQTPLHWPLCTWAATVLVDHPRSAAGRESSAAGDDDVAAAAAVVGTDAAVVSLLR